MNVLQSNTQRLPEGEPVERLRAFFNRYRGRKQDQPQGYTVVAEFLQRFKDGHNELQRAEQKWEEETAPRFNIFRALRIERRETKLHSRFLAELLDPRGSHSQGVSFLSGFLEIATDRGLRAPSGPWDRSDWHVTTEEAVNEADRLDIVLRCRNRAFIAVIENK